MSVDAAVRPGISAPPAEELPRLLAGIRSEPLSLAEHVRRYGELPVRSGRGRRAYELIELVEASGLRGRGGAGFPTARKLWAVAAARRRPVVVANGTEGEPVSGKDDALLRHVPHLVLDGAAAAAAAVGAREAIVAVGAGAAEAVAALGTAIAERGRRDRVAFRLATVPEGFVTGEETALVNWLGGGAARPTFTPPQPFERGLRGAPTLVQNVETLAQLALVVRFGPDWFRAVGTRAEPGSALVTLGGAVRRPGVYEIPLGLPLPALLARAGGTTEPIAAVLVGGYFGTWITAGEADSAALADASLRTVGAALGARAIFVLPQSVCGLVETARVARYLADESAGQCGPCVHGLDAIASALAHRAWGDGRAASDAVLGRWLGQVEGRGACKHPDGAGRFVASGLRVFAAELERHGRGTCSGSHRPLLPVGNRDGIPR
jgi:NADH:ubiquinone oxidoreductase subunit F (NADH-binding)